jgi:asparagine synthase (glutamine-hydrolysing)
MGALYGYLNFNKKPESNLPEIMSSPALYWGSDKHFKYSADNIFIGNLHRFNTPEAVYEQQPYEPIPNSYLFFTGRIDNRKDLTSKLNIKDEPNIPDGLFVSKAWEKYRTNLVDHLEGDWVIAVWEANEKKLHILCDHHGYSALYYYCNENFFAFATSIKSLLAIEAIPKKPNMKRVAQVLTSWQGSGLDCAYEGILRLPPAHAMEIDLAYWQAGNNFKIKQYKHWFPENTKTVNFPNEKDYYSKFFEEYSRAVEVRLRSYKAVGSQLSGGLDSGTVVALAALHLKKKGIRLPAFTSTPAFDVKGLTSKKRFGDEAYLAKLTADYTGNTDWFPIDALNVNPFDAIKEGIKIHDEPFHAGSNTFWINEIKRVAQEMNLGSMLTGQGGNATVSWPTPGFLQIMSRKKDLIKPKDFFSYYGLRHVIAPLYVPQSVKNFIRNKQKGSLPFLEYSAIKKEYAINNRIAQQMQEEDHDPSFAKTTSPLRTRLKIIKPGSSIIGFLHSQAAAWNNLEMRDPTFDKRLMEYCLSVPDHIYVSGGKDRMLLRKSFDGIMPPEVLWNTNVGRQAADIGHRIVKFQDTGRAILDNLSQSPLCNEILDIDRMKLILNDLTKEVNAKNTNEAGTVLLRGITAGLFLLRFE